MKGGVSGPTLPMAIHSHCFIKINETTAFLLGKNILLCLISCHWYMPLVFQLTIITQFIGGETFGGQYPKSTFYFDFAKRAFSPGPKLLVCSLYNTNSDMYFDINF